MTRFRYKGVRPVNLDLRNGTGCVITPGQVVEIPDDVVVNHPHFVKVGKVTKKDEVISPTVLPKADDKGKGETNNAHPWTTGSESKGSTKKG